MFFFLLIRCHPISRQGSASARSDGYKSQSEWCRCKQKAKYAFNNYETKSFLNSFFSQKFAHNKDKQVKELKDYILNWEGKKNLILVTHYVVISEILNVSTSSGEIVITDRNFNILTSINTSTVYYTNLTLPTNYPV